jgi:signal transduction histidine kinase
MSNELPLQNASNEHALSLLAASSVHDIKNSLSMLLQTLEEVIRATPNQSTELRKQFGTLQGEAVRINNDLIYFLGLYRLQKNQLPLQIQSVFVADFLQEQVVTNALLFEIRDITLTVDCDDKLGAYFDPALIAGIVNNVLVNAARYAKKSVEILAATIDGQLVIEVRDDGNGFPEKMLLQGNAQIGINADRSIDFSTGSTNLGLHFAAEVAAMHKRGDICGGIELRNLSEGGGCFTLRLP